MKLNAYLAVVISVIASLLLPEWTFATNAAQLYEQKCSRCHTAYEPADFAADEWPAIVRSMKAQAALSAQEMDEIIDYLVSESGNNESISSGPALGGYLYTEYFQAEDKKRKNFDIHYLAISVSGWANDRIYYLGEFEFEHGGKGDNAFVEQAYLDYWVQPNVGLKIGSILTPFNRFDEFHDPLTNPIITRPQVSREIGVSAWKDVGVDLHGFFNINDQNTILFDLYTINGLGSGSTMRGSRQYRDNNENRAVGGRVNYVFRDFLELGGSGYQGAWDDDSDYNLTLIGSHFMLNTDIVDLYGEFASATSENPPDTSNVSVDDGEMSGYFIQ